MVRRFAPRKYQRLTDYLAALPGTAVTLTFPEIEAIVGFALPSTAHHAPFWTNSPRGTFDLRPWVRAGWRVARTELYSRPPVVHFVRAVPDATA